MKIINKSGKRIDGKASDKEIKKKLKEEDPIIRNAVKDENIEEYSPMDPPDAYDENRSVVKGIEIDKMDKVLLDFVEEHNNLKEVIDKFNGALDQFKEKNYHLTKEINDTFNEFFVYFDNEIMPHNKQEERFLFPILHKRLLEVGEHGDQNITAVDLMEDDHVKFIQLASLSFNFLGLAARLPDDRSRYLVLDLAFHNSKELVELLKLHIFRENNTLFPLAQKHLTTEELKEVLNQLNHE